MARMPVRRSSPQTSTHSAPTQPGRQANVEVPKTNSDPIWSLCPWPVTVDIRGKRFEIEALPAAHWLRYLLVTDGSVDLIGLLDDLMPDVDDFFFDNEVAPQEQIDLILEIIAIVSARPWWLTMRLAHLAANNWHILGPKIVANGGDALQMSLAGWLDILVYQMMDSIDPDKATMFTMQLTAPPAIPGEPEPDPFKSTEIDRRSFMAMA